MADNNLTVKDQMFLSILNGLLSNSLVEGNMKDDHAIVRRAMKIANDAYEVRLSPHHSTGGF